MGQLDPWGQYTERFLAEESPGNNSHWLVVGAAGPRVLFLEAQPVVLVHGFFSAVFGDCGREHRIGCVSLRGASDHAFWGPLDGKGTSPPVARVKHRR